MPLSVLVKITILSTVCGIGTSFLLFGCILPNSYWSLFILLFYLFLPLPLLIAASYSRDQTNTSFYELAILITTILVVSTFGLPIVFYLKGYIQSLGLLLSVIGNAILLSAAVVYILLFHFEQIEFS